MSACTQGTKYVAGIRVWPFRFRLCARSPVYFPAGKAANILRGALGSLFRKVACVPGCRAASTCDFAANCPYARAFEPKQDYYSVGGPSGLRDLPRPFAFRAYQLDGVRFDSGKMFCFDVVLFESPERLLPYLVLAFRELAWSGLGPARGSAELISVEDLESGKLIYQNSVFNNASYSGFFCELTSTTDGTETTFRVEFLTPTELKASGQVAGCPEFSTVFSRLRDRISNLCVFYQRGSLDVNFRELGKAAAQVVLQSGSIRHIDVERQSSRTGQLHSIGGFVGTVEYRGDLGLFLPFLRAGEWVGVGRQTVWGKGVFRLQ